MESQIENVIEKEKLLVKEKDFWQGFYAGFTIVFLTGFCDKLFFLNMIYSSINNFCSSFWVILAISETMNIINISLGEVLKQYISITILEYIAIGIFLLLAICLIYNGYNIPEKKLIQNYEEERKLLINSKNNNEENENNNIEEDKNNENNYKLVEVVENNEEKKGKNVGVFDSWWKFFITYFFASIGEKSQIASILITCKYNFVPIYNGSAIAIIFLVLLAMSFGEAISRFLTNRQISMVCGILFLLYALVFFLDRNAGKILSLY